MSRLAHFRDSKGHGWQVLIQAMIDSCGPAAVTMAEGLSLHKPVSEQRVREISGLYPGGWSTSTFGTSKYNVLAVLVGSAGLTATLHQTRGDTAASLLRHAHKAKPAIAFVEWEGGGPGHVIVCPRMYHDGTTVFLDPLFGLVEMPREALPDYNAHNGQLSQYTLDDEWGTIKYVITID